MFSSLRRRGWRGPIEASGHDQPPVDEHELVRHLRTPVQGSRPAGHGTTGPAVLTCGLASSAYSVKFAEKSVASSRALAS